MTTSNHTDTQKSLGPLSDDEALAIMEGRLPAGDSPEVDQAARAIVSGLDSEQATDSNVVELFTQQPWMKMAASLMLGVMLTTLVGSRVSQTDGSSVATANVTYLETLRSVDAARIPTVALTEDQWVTLIVYPDFADAEHIRVYVERRLEPQDQWALVLQQQIGVGTQDSVVVNIESKTLTIGMHRLRIEAESGGRATATTAFQFLVESNS